MGMPDLSRSFPKVDPALKISADLNNRAHGPHHDMMRAINGGTDQVRISPTGDIMGGTTNIGPAKMSW